MSKNVKKAYKLRKSKRSKNLEKSLECCSMSKNTAKGFQTSKDP